MGKMHMNGLGANRNCQTATGFFKEVIEMGDEQTIQLWKHAFTSYEAGNKASALMYYLWLADLGYEVAQVNSAQMIQEERNSGILTKEEVEVAKNENNGGFVRAKYNLQRAADQSNLCASFATLHLGDYYYIYEQNYRKFGIVRFWPEKVRFWPQKSGFGPKSHFLSKKVDFNKNSFFSLK